MTKIKERDEYTTIKIIATFLVVIGHIAKFYYPGGGVFPVDPNAVIGGIAEIIYAFHMPLFVFVSGAIYSYNVNQLGKYKNIRSFIIRKFQRLMIPYFCWGIGYVTPVMVLLGITDLSAGVYIVRCILLGGDSRHLWYLWTLFWIFVICGFLRFFSQKINKYILFGAVAIGLTGIYLYTGLAPIWNLLYYGFYFLIGYFFDLYKEKIDGFFAKKGWIFIILCPGLILPVFMETNLFLDVILALEGIALSYYLIKRFHFRLEKWKFYSLFAKDSFGIYLVHPMLIYIVFYYFGGMNYNPYLFCIVVFLLILTVSCAVVELLRKIHCQILLGG